MKNDQEKWITDLKADNVRLKRDNDRFVASMEAKVNEHLEKTQAQLLRDCENMKNEISEMQAQETKLESEVPQTLVTNAIGSRNILVATHTTCIHVYLCS